MKTFTGIVLLASFIGVSYSIFAGRSFETVPTPFFVRINLANERVITGLFVAGGTLISDQHVLCAGSTLDPTNRVINVHAGGNRRTIQRVFEVNRTLLHQQYSSSPRINDIGIVFLTQPLRFDNSIRPIALPLIVEHTVLTDQIQGQVLGFGGNVMSNQQPGSEILEGAFVRVNNASFCSTMFPNIQTNVSFCAEDTRQRSDFCLQDVGGGFTVLQRGIEVIVGIASIPRCIQSTSVQSLPSLYTNVIPFVGWIRQETGL